MLHFLKLMLQLILAPTRGWDDIAVSADSPQYTLRHGLLPLAAVASVTVFIGAFYQVHPSFSRLFIQAVVTFVKYAVTYYAGVTVLTIALPWLSIDGLVDRARVELFCAYCVGMMAVVGAVEHFLPMELSLLQFLPLVIIAVMCYGRTYLDVDERNIFKFAGVATLSIILPVYFIDWLMPAV